MAILDSSSAGNQQAGHPPSWIVVMGATSGGPQALAQLLPQFPAGFPGTIIVVQQMRPGFIRVLAEQLQPLCNLPVIALQDRQPVLASRIFVTSSATRLVVDDDLDSPNMQILIEEVKDGPESNASSVDSIMTSAASIFRNQTVGVLLTGLGRDGREGMGAIRAVGGMTIAQDQATSVVFAMPNAAIEAGVVDDVLPLWGIADRIVSLVGGKAGAYAA